MGFRIRFEKKHKFFLALGVLFVILDFIIIFDTAFFVPALLVAITIAWLPQWLDFFAENQMQKDIEARFPDFVRNLTSAIKSGMPAAQGVVHISEGDYGSLTPYVRKLANQVEWAIPFHRAFANFGRETNNAVIKRAIATVVEAERAGGNMEDVLASIVDSLIQIKRIKEERKAAIHAQVVQAYIIFTVFLGVMVIIQNVLIPFLGGIQGSTTGLFGGPTLGGTLTQSAVATKVSFSFSSPAAFLSSLTAWFSSIYGIFLMISIIQGFFTGVVLGKLAEGDLTSGLKHSLIMMTAAFILISFAQSFV